MSSQPKDETIHTAQVKHEDASGGTSRSNGDPPLAGFTEEPQTVTTPPTVAHNQIKAGQIVAENVEINQTTETAPGQQADKRQLLSELIFGCNILLLLALFPLLAYNHAINIALGPLSTLLSIPPLGGISLAIILLALKHYRFFEPFHRNREIVLEEMVASRRFTIVVLCIVGFLTGADFIHWPTPPTPAAQWNIRLNGVEARTGQPLTAPEFSTLSVSYTNTLATTHSDYWVFTVRESTHDVGNYYPEDASMRPASNEDDDWPACGGTSPHIVTKGFKQLIRIGEPTDERARFRVMIVRVAHKDSSRIAAALRTWCRNHIQAGFPPKDPIFRRSQTLAQIDVIRTGGMVTAQKKLTLGTSVVRTGDTLEASAQLVNQTGITVTLTVAARPPHSSDAGGPFPDFLITSPFTGKSIALPRGQPQEIQAARMFTLTDIQRGWLGQWHSYLTYQTPDGEYHDIDPRVYFTFVK